MQNETEAEAWFRSLLEAGPPTQAASQKEIIGTIAVTLRLIEADKPTGIFEGEKIGAA
jgi:hypothetical protein